MDLSSFFGSNEEQQVHTNDPLIKELKKKMEDTQKQIVARQQKLQEDEENQPVDIGLNNIRFTTRPLINYGKLVSKNEKNLRDVPWKDIIYGLKDSDAIRKGLGVTSIFNRDIAIEVTFNQSPLNKKDDKHITLKFGTKSNEKDIRIDKIGFTLKTEYLRIVSNDNRIIDFVMRNAEDIRKAVNILITLKKITKKENIPPIIAENSKFVSDTIVQWPRLGPANENASNLFDKNIKKLLKSVTIIDDNEEIKNSLKASANEILGRSSPAPSFKDNTINPDVITSIPAKFCVGNLEKISCGETGFRDKQIELGLTQNYAKRFKATIDDNKYPFVIFVYAPEDGPPPLLKECTSATFIKSMKIFSKDGQYHKATLEVGSTIEKAALKEDFLQQLKGENITSRNRSRFIFLRGDKNDPNKLYNLLQGLHGKQFLTSDKIVAQGGRNELQLKKQTISNNKKSLKSKNNKIIINRSLKDRNNNMMLKRTIKKNIKR